MFVWGLFGFVECGLENYERLFLSVELFVDLLNEIFDVGDVFFVGELGELDLEDIFVFDVGLGY